MILEQKVIDILKEELPKEFQWNGIYDKVARKIVKEIKEEIVR
jgi:hypothetical protein|tara:strand:- start:148 stop:276 length:129 start_codon:yes stop_codon:yes gene_type:complete